MDPSPFFSTSRTPPYAPQGLKKGDKGLCLIAGDIYPIDVISHLPVMCEERDTPYIYVPSKHDLGVFGFGLLVQPWACCVLLWMAGYVDEIVDHLAGTHAFFVCPRARA